MKKEKVNQNKINQVEIECFLKEWFRNTNEEIDFEFNDHLSPSLVRPHNDSTYTCVVMPMRI